MTSGSPIVIRSVQRPYRSTTLHHGSQSLPPVILPQTRLHHQLVRAELATFHPLHFSGTLLMKDTINIPKDKCFWIVLLCRIIRGVVVDSYQFVFADSILTPLYKETPIRFDPLKGKPTLSKLNSIGGV